MVVKSLLLLLIALLVLPLTAQETDLIELSTETLEYEALSELYRELGTLGGSLGLDSSLYLRENDPYSLHSVISRFRGDYLLLNTRFGYDEGSAQANFSLNIRGKKLVRQVSLGSYRLHFGRGIIAGSGKRTMPTTAIDLERPPRANVYSPLGAAAILGYRDISLLGFGSIQSRRAKLSGEDILSLPSTKTDDLGKSLESIYGAALSYEKGILGVAAMAYRQDFDRDFADPDLDSGLTAFSIYAALKLKRHIIDAESAWLNGRHSSRVRWEMSYGGFTQSFTHANNPARQYTAYSVSPAVLSRRVGAEELSWEARMPLAHSTFLLTRLSFNDASTENLGDSYISRQMAAVEYKDTRSLMRMSLYRFDREILYQIDESYQSTIPQHYRAQVYIHTKLIPVLVWTAQVRYHFERKSIFDQSTFYAENALDYSYGKLRAGIAWTRWQSLREFVIPDDQEPGNYIQTSGEDSTLALNTSYAFKHWRLAATWRHSLEHSDRYQLTLRLGLSL